MTITDEFITANLIPVLNNEPAAIDARLEFSPGFAYNGTPHVMKLRVGTAYREIFGELDDLICEHKLCPLHDLTLEDFVNLHRRLTELDAERDLLIRRVSDIASGVASELKDAPATAPGLDISDADRKAVRLLSKELRDLLATALDEGPGPYSCDPQEVTGEVREQLIELMENTK